MIDETLAKACIHCGFCLPVCPTYLLWGEEMDSPRGRIALMRQSLEPGGDLGGGAVHIDRCLGCMACVTGCPSGVRYDRLIEAARPEVERAAPRSWRERAFRTACFAVLTHPARLRRLAPLASVARRFDAPARLARFPRLAALTALAVTASHRTTPVFERVEPPGGGSTRSETTDELPAVRERVGLLQGCVARVFFGDVNAATIRVLTAEGYEVTAPDAPRCCGALHLHSGEVAAARDLAREAIAALEGCDLVAVNAAGCGSAMKEYGELLAGDPAWTARAHAFAAKVRDVTEILAAAPPRAPRHPLPMTVAYHDACHLAHAQRVRSEPRTLLGQIPGLVVVEVAEGDVCCGSAGLYNVFQPEAADLLGERKAANVRAARVDVVAAGNPGCALQLTRHLALSEQGSPPPVVHTVELVDRSIRGVTVAPAAGSTLNR